MDNRDIWPPVWYISGAVLLLVLCFVGWVAFGGGKARPATPGPAPGGPAVVGHPESGPAPQGGDIIGRFDDWLKKNEPKVTMVKYHDLVNGKEIQVPSVEFHNLVGGTSSDMMWLALGLDPSNPRRPVPGPQEWQLKLMTSPSSLATYMEIDLMNVQAHRSQDDAAHMPEWDLSKLCPPLAAIAPDQWTDDERNYDHYFTIRQMGFNGTEAGFAALDAAYASNFALWHGDRRAVPGAAYYALAAAEFEKSLAAHELPSDRTTAATWMICGELHRLLGQFADAQRCLDEAQKLRSSLEPPEQNTLDFYREQVQARNADLQLMPDTHVPTPPIGWFIEYLLPAINGDLQVERGKWSSYTDIDSIISTINAEIAANGEPPASSPAPAPPAQQAAPGQR